MPFVLPKLCAGVVNLPINQTYSERINDWLEVDAIVCSLSDDIIDSFDPQDHDNDGVAEDRGALLQNRERLDDFLPDDEREKRAKEAKQERWAINVI